MMTANTVKVRLEDVAIIMNPEIDQAAVAREDIPSGTVLDFQGELIEIRSFIRKAHRFALHDIREGEFVRQYGYPFGQSKGISRGELITAININNVLPETDLEDFK
ncbi:MAG TPA: SAF domain-containing protein, partial [Nitrospirota bacterium]|nr:SAF domain-containing protein [Nitrospirota bacterium]